VDYHKREDCYRSKLTGGDETKVRRTKPVSSPKKEKSVGNKWGRADAGLRTWAKKSRMNWGSSKGLETEET